MHCNGRCYLMSKLKQVNEKEKKQAAKDNLNRMEISYLHQPYIVCPHPPLISSSAAHFPQYKFTYYSQYITAVFRPPKSLV